MKKFVAIFFALLMTLSTGWGQTTQPQEPPYRPQEQQEREEPQAQEPQAAPEQVDPGDIPDVISIPAGTHIPMTIVRTPQDAPHEGERVYLRTRVPIHAEGRVVIPARTLVVGLLTGESGPGAGHGAMSVRLRTIVFPNEYRMAISGRVLGILRPGNANGGQQFAGSQPQSPLGALTSLTPEQLAAISTFALVGGQLGLAVGKTPKGGTIGTLIGAGIGFAAVMAMNQSHLHLRVGANVDGVLDEPLALGSKSLQ
ncbi:MAG TPA: hypothetical protein VLW54_15005 [Candidatus Acidoferrales bacterium]|nr:hypothetical protein [Candidatus Acidoferrales bacterium]